MYKKIISFSGFGLSAYGLGALVLSKFVPTHATQSWWIQVFACIFGGLALHYSTKMDYAKWIPLFLKGTTINVEIDPYYSSIDNVDELATAFKASRDSEGIEECKKLHNLLFDRKYLK